MSARTVEIAELAELLIAQAHDRRIVAAVAGAPGSGKSTLAEKLVEEIESRRPGLAAILPMDGYHYDDVLLEEMGRRAHKGAPDTFDVGGYRHMLERLRADDEAEVAVPVFDRTIEIARAGSRLVRREARIIVTEGNYLLLREPPWSTLRPLFDATVFIDVPEEVLRKRLAARWHGYGMHPKAIRAKLEDNDLPNGRRVIAESIEPDFRIEA